MCESHVNIGKIVTKKKGKKGGRKRKKKSTI